MGAKGFCSNLFPSLGQATNLSTPSVYLLVDW